ncbi:MAG: peptide deformylase [Synergistota bacterium]|mgnify:CR=1 FL=1|jgi:peptide deformylase|nr:peptide deformylase [Synergistota bacterium]OPZ41121.1 MAG: Peptide deformylase [Synergistetes bacterium ADurb.BinA166]
MNTLRLRVFPDPILRENTEPVADFGDELKDIVAEMVRLMRVHDGVGLAAPQAGLSLRLAVVLFEDTLHVLANPELLSSEGEQDGEEGCLSFPGIFGNVRRPERITIRHRDIDGTELETTVEGFLARAFLHEMDHLDGRLLIDHFSPVKRAMSKKKLLRSRASGEEGQPATL